METFTGPAQGLMDTILTPAHTLLLGVYTNSCPTFACNNETVTQEFLMYKLSSLEIIIPT